VLSLGTFLVGTNGFVIAGLLPDIAEGIGATASGVGLSITVYAAVVGVLAPTFATIFARVPRTVLIAAGMVLTGAGTAVTAIAGDLPAFIAGRAVAGVGGAAIVPTAVAAAAVMVPASRRARAIAIVTLGFTFSTAIGSPLGAAVAHVGGWRLPLAGVAVLCLISAVVAALVLRVPSSPPISIRHRLAVLADPRLLLTLLSTVFTIAAFNIAYIYSSTYTAHATGGSGALLAGLLLLYGLGGIAGNQLAGRLTDRYGNRVVASILMATHFAVLAVMPLALSSYAALAVVFVVWGSAAFGTGIAIQDRLVAIDPARGSVSVSWYSTGVYVGIAIAPVVGAATIDLFGPPTVPLAAAVAVLVAAALFAASFLARGRSSDPARGGAT